MTTVPLDPMSPAFQQAYLAECDRIEKIGKFWEASGNHTLIFAGRWLQSVAKTNRGYLTNKQYDKLVKAYQEMQAVPTPPGMPS